MKRVLGIFLTLVLSGSFSPFLHGQEIALRQTKFSGLYKTGEKITVTAYPGEIKEDSIRVRIIRNNYTELFNKSLRISGDSIVLFHGSFDSPCTVMVEAVTGKIYSAIGFAVDPGKIRPGEKYPRDFKKFWNKEKSQLKALPFEVKSAAVGLPEGDSAYTCENIEINCTGPKPARGYFARPKNINPGSMPAVLLVHAAGVKGSWCRSEPENAMRYARKGALCFDLNAHGMLNGQPESYYADLEAGELNMYYVRGLTSTDEIYFRGMYLRMLRAIDFLARQPGWDGKRIMVIGESQGGGQALAAAGLDSRVTAAVAIVPAMCDWLGPLADHEGGWPQPLKTDFPREQLLKTLPYFDPANILKGSKATLFVEIGLIDITCPAASVYAAVNQSGGKKNIYAVPYRQHHQPQNSLTKTWEETVYRPRENFIIEFLK